MRGLQLAFCGAQLAVLLALLFSGGARAADVDMRFSATTVKAGDALIVTIRSKKFCKFQMVLEDEKNHEIEARPIEARKLTPPSKYLYMVNTPGRYWIYMKVVDPTTCGDAADYDAARQFTVVAPAAK